MNRNLLLLFLFFTILISGLSAQAPNSVVEVYRIFQAKCTGCHKGAEAPLGLDLEGTGATESARAVNVAQRLVNIDPATTGAKNTGWKRIYPGRPDWSFLFRKINSGFEPGIPALAPEHGSAMPQSGYALSNLEKEIVRQWILYGARTSGVQFDKSVVASFYEKGGDRAFPAGPPPAPAPGEGFQIKMGPFYLAPDGEVEYYQKHELRLPADVEINRLDFAISGSSHHFVLYNFTGNTPGSNVLPGLRLNANHADINLMAAVQEQAELRLPELTAFRWPKNAVLDLNSHYINYSLSKPYQCEAYVNVYTQPNGSAKQEMFASLIPNPVIPIANNGNTITYQQSVFGNAPDSIYLWGLMGHTHKYGRGYKVWKRLPNGQRGELLYDASCPQGVPGCLSPFYDYQHIPIRYWTPLLPIRWSHGIIHEAKWVNDGPAPVSFGPTSDDEMMVLIAFYTLKPLAVGVEEPADARESLLITPNPAADKVWVRLPGRGKIGTAALFDATGRLLLRQTGVAGEGLEFDVSGLPAGLYFVQLDDRIGKLIRQ